MGGNPTNQRLSGSITGGLAAWTRHSLGSASPTPLPLEQRGLSERAREAEGSGEGGGAAGLVGGWMEGEPEAAPEAVGRDAAAVAVAAATAESSSAAEEAGPPERSSQAGSGATAGTDANAAGAGAGAQPGWNQMQGQPPPGFQPVMPGGMMGMMTPDGFIPGSASL